MKLKYNSFLKILKKIFSGFLVGISIIIPGISGSTILITMNLYDEIICSLSNLFKSFKKSIIFLIPIIIGIIIGIIFGLLVIKLLLNLFPFITICLFTGFMIGSFPIIFDEIKHNKPKINNIILLIIGFIIPLLVSILSIYLNNNNGYKIIEYFNFNTYLLFFIIGIIMSLTQLIPGLSATVLLMIIGYYQYLVENINIDIFDNINLLFVYIIIFIGFIVGILIFSKFINNLLINKRIEFFYLINGLSLSSIFCMFISNDCINIYKNWVDMEIDLILGLGCLILGFLNTFTIYLYNRRIGVKNEKQ